MSIVGDGPIRSELETLVTESPASDSIRFLGWKTQEELRELMADHQVFVLPSIIGPEGDEESQGLALQEAQAAGLPVIASRLGGIPEGLIDRQTGFLFTPGDHHDLAACLVNHIQNRARWGDMSEDARLFVRQEFDIEQHLSNLQSVYLQARKHQTQVSEGRAHV